MMLSRQPPRPILIGHGNRPFNQSITGVSGADLNGRRQTSSDSDRMSSWGDDENFNEDDFADLAFVAEKQYNQSQAAVAAVQAPSSTVSHVNGVPKVPANNFTSALQKQGTPQRPPFPRPGITYRPSQNHLVSQQRPRGPFPPGPGAPGIRPQMPFNNSQRPMGLPMGSQIPPRLGFASVTPQQNVPGDREQLLREIQELKTKVAHLEYTQIGAATSFKEKMEKKDEELRKKMVEDDTACHAATAHLAKTLEEVKRKYEQQSSDLLFKNQEMEGLKSRLQQVEAERKRAEETAQRSEAGSNGRLTPLKRPAVDTGGFPNLQTFHQNTAKRARRTVDPAPPMEVVPVKPPCVTTGIQTDPMEIELPPDFMNEMPQSDQPKPADSIRPAPPNGCDQMEGVEEERRDQHVRSYEIIHELNDSRPVVEERFTLAVLLQPLPHFEVTSSYEFDLEKKKQWDKQLLTRSGPGRLPKKIVKGALHNFLTNSRSATTAVPSYPSHLIAQEAIALFVGRDKQAGNRSKLSFMLGALLPVLTDHLRQYASFLHNMSALVNAGKAHVIDASQIAAGGEVSLTVFFKSVLANPSLPALKFVETVERNAKLALIVLRKLLDRYPELHPFVMRDMESPQQVYSTLATMFSELKPLGEGLNLEVDTDNDAAAAAIVARVDAGPLIPRRANSTHWRNIRDKLSAKYRMDQHTQEAAMIQLVQVPEQITKISALKLILMLCDPMQFKVSQRSVLALSAGAVASLAASVGINSKEAKDMGERMLADDVLVNYVSSADTPDTLEPVVRLFQVLIRWKFLLPRLCTGDSSTCLLGQIYRNVFASLDLPKPLVLQNVPLHFQVLQSLLDVIISNEEDTKLLLFCPTRHCVLELIEQFVEVLYSNVEYVCAVNFYADEPVDILPAVRQFITNGVLWMFAMKMQAELDLQTYMTVVYHRFRSLVVVLHDDRLFEYDKDFEAVLDQLYQAMSPTQP